MNPFGMKKLCLPSCREKLVNNLWAVYGIKARGDSKFRYVGKTTWGTVHRLRQHLSEARTKSSKRRINNWINYVGTENVVIIPLEFCPIGDAHYLNYAERYWIAELRYLGHDLVNHTIGGDGTSGYKLSDETRKRISEVRIASGVAKGDKNPRFGIRGEAHPMFGVKGERHPGYGYRDTPERIEQKRVFATGRTHTSEAKAKISAANKGKPKSDEVKLKIKTTQHLNHHVNRDIINPRCTLCIPSTVSE